MLAAAPSLALHRLIGLTYCTPTPYPLSLGPTLHGRLTKTRLFLPQPTCSTCCPERALEVCEIPRVHLIEEESLLRESPPISLADQPPQCSHAECQLCSLPRVNDPRMAPTLALHRRAETVNGSWRAFATDEDLVLESWSQGCLVGSLLIMGCITVANMRRGVLLHKLILLEQLAALSHGKPKLLGCGFPSYQPAQVPSASSRSPVTAGI